MRFQQTGQESSTTISHYRQRRIYYEKCGSREPMVPRLKYVYDVHNLQKSSYIYLLAPMVKKGEVVHWFCLLIPKSLRARDRIPAWLLVILFVFLKSFFFSFYLFILTQPFIYPIRYISAQLLHRDDNPHGSPIPKYQNYSLIPNLNLSQKPKGHTLKRRSKTLVPILICSCFLF